MLTTRGTQRVTAANASGINDGAAAIILASGEAVEKYGLKPMAKLIGWGQGGVDPKIMGVGPVVASRNAMAKAGVTIDDIDLVEANEAFAAQSIAVARELGFDMSKVNVNGLIGHDGLVDAALGKRPVRDSAAPDTAPSAALIPWARHWENTRLSTSSYWRMRSSPRVELRIQLPIYTRSSRRRNCFSVILISIRIHPPRRRRGLYCMQQYNRPGGKIPLKNREIRQISLAKGELP